MGTTERPRLNRLRQLPLIALTPNILTLLALCAGLTSVRFALNERWELAVVGIFVAAIFDGLDGRVARLLQTSSKFGAELDSLADFVSFGVAPGLVLYLWSLHAGGGLGWVIALVYIICVGLRLARFNTALEDPAKAVIASHFFTGVPSPPGGGLALLPIILYFQFGWDAFRSPFLVGLWALIVGALMVSSLPTYAFKKLRVRREFVMPTLLVIGLFAASIASMPWATLATLGIAYMATFPFSHRAHRRMTQAPAFVPPEVLPPEPQGANGASDFDKAR
jgi:CDP-diacylglycerol--serine O-phosphatidyltransferase